MAIDAADRIRLDTSDDLGPLPKFLRPFVDWVAGIHATVHRKLLSGFLLISLLLLSMGLLSVAVLGRLSDQVETLNALNHQASQARDMIYGVTAQSHYRAMAPQAQRSDLDPEDLRGEERLRRGSPRHPYERRRERNLAARQVEATNEAYATSSDAVTELFNDDKIEQALALHIDQEHEISHDLEAHLGTLIADSEGLVAAETESFASNRRFPTIAVAGFSGVSLLIALTLGAILSWSLIRPVRRVDAALEQIAEGDFETRVDVPNRDEFGNLTRNLNRTTGHLSTLYRELQELNDNLQQTVETKVAELERTSRLRRYLSPKLADSIVSGSRDVTLGPSRKFLTTFFSDVRGFTAAAEQMEPEELGQRAQRLLLGDDRDRVQARRHARQVRRRRGDGLLRGPDPAGRPRRAGGEHGAGDARAHAFPRGPLVPAIRPGLRDRHRHRDRVGDGRRHRLPLVPTTPCWATR